MTTAAHTTRLCEKCVSNKPITEFRRRSRSGLSRLYQCRTCHNRAERKRRADKRSQKNHRLIARRLTQLKNLGRNDQVENLIAEMIRQFGGVQGLAEAWTNYFHRAREQGGFAALRCVQSSLRMIQYCEQNQLNLSELSDDELKQALMDQAKRLILQHPELAVEAAREVGWSVLPQTDTPIA